MFNLHNLWTNQLLPFNKHLQRPGFQAARSTRQGLFSLRTLSYSQTVSANNLKCFLTYTLLSACGQPKNKKYFYVRMF